jgi:hypothetical protein
VSGAALRSASASRSRRESGTAAGRCAATAWSWERNYRQKTTGSFRSTSQRAAYLGSRKTMEFPYAKLMNVEVFTDGIRFHASNRQRTPLFAVSNGEIVAATLNAAMQRLED